jgi:hypothetical protein
MPRDGSKPQESSPPICLLAAGKKKRDAVRMINVQRIYKTVAFPLLFLCF